MLGNRTKSRIRIIQEQYVPYQEAVRSRSKRPPLAPYALFTIATVSQVAQLSEEAQKQAALDLNTLRKRSRTPMPTFPKDMLIRACEFSGYGSVRQFLSVLKGLFTQIHPDLSQSNLQHIERTLLECQLWLGILCYNFNQIPLARKYFQSLRETKQAPFHWLASINLALTYPFDSSEAKQYLQDAQNTSHRSTKSIVDAMYQEARDLLRPTDTVKKLSQLNAHRQK